MTNTIDDNLYALTIHDVRTLSQLTLNWPDSAAALPLREWLMLAVSDEMTFRTEFRTKTTQLRLSTWTRSEIAEGLQAMLGTQRVWRKSHRLRQLYGAILRELITTAIVQLKMD